MSFMGHWDFEMGSQFFFFLNTLGREGEGHTKEYSVYALENVDNSGRPLM